MPRPVRDITNQMFGKLTAVALSDPLLWKTNSAGKRRTTWVCVCDCGGLTIVRGDHLLAGMTRSCSLSCRSLVHGAAADGHRTPEYDSWRNMKRRCLAPSHPDYHNYGGRGIEVCQEWQDSFQAFLAHVGEKPAPKELYSLDRIDNEGGYEPENVRWATWTEQNNNRRTS